MHCRLVISWVSTHTTCTKSTALIWLLCQFDATQQSVITVGMRNQDELSLRVLDAGGQEEQKCRSNADEPGLQPVSLHLHHHSREAAAGRWQSEPRHVGPFLLQYAAYTLVSALWYWVIAVQTFMNVGLQVAERVLHRIAAIPFAQADKSATPLLSHCLLHRERQGLPAAFPQHCYDSGCN